MRQRLLPILPLTLAGVLCFTSCGPGTNRADSDKPEVSAGMDVYDAETPSDILKKYSGRYSVQMKNNAAGTSSEFYELKEDGSATRIWVNAGETSDKAGKWAVKGDSIIISIQGNTSLINETFVLNAEGEYADDLTGARILELTQ